MTGERDFGDVFFARRGAATDGPDVEEPDEFDEFDEPEDGPDARPDRRRSALLVLGGVVVLIAVVITLVSVLVDTSPGAPVTPRTTAQAWAGAVVGGHDDHRRNLECAGGSQSGAIVRQVVAVASSASAGPARLVGRLRWSVPVSFVGPDGADVASVPVTVIRQGRRYVVC